MAHQADYAVVLVLLMVTLLETGYNQQLCQWCGVFFCPPDLVTDCKLGTCYGFSSCLDQPTWDIVYSWRLSLLSDFTAASIYSRFGYQLLLAPGGTLNTSDTCDYVAVHLCAELRPPLRSALVFTKPQFPLLTLYCWFVLVCPGEVFHELIWFFLLFYNRRAPNSSINMDRVHVL